MARTLTFGDLIATISKKISRTTEEDFAALICSMTIQEIWKRYDWRESIETLPSFWLSPRMQDYGAPLNIVPQDFEGLRTALLVQFTGNPARIIPLDITKNLDRTNVYSFPSAMSYNHENSCFRIWPNVPENWGCPDHMITGTYKKLPVSVLPSSYQGTALPFDDKYFFPIVETALWKGYKLNGSPMEEKAQLSALTAIDEMARDQGLNDGDSNITPSSSLALTSGNFQTGFLWR
ncbi:hypothetical protein UFOVP434_42 [uncultured Caudovirales phage]|uniref:Uncharacterized protein n=1 Tax=uncultured Caudovirales phage TaxID=2100421 RepID=A0A6J5M9D5_9CAUD|nr:hypothetical protein UFOVP434_42 [uncultured Caudovirales phage]